MIRLVSAWMLVNGLLMASSWGSAALGASPAPWLSVEAAVIAGGMALLPRRSWTLGLGWAAAVGVVSMAVATLADLVFRQSLGRSLDLAIDLYLLDAVYRLAVGNIGLLKTLLGCVLVTAAVALSVLGTGWLLAPAPSAGDDARSRQASRLAAGLVGGALALAALGQLVPAVGRRFVAPGAAFLREQTALLEAARAERAAFAADLEAEPRRFADLPGLLGGLEGRHVVLAYVESYGMAALEDPELAAGVRPALDRAASRLDAAGLAVASGRLESPTVGGQSWYAHGTMLSGLWLENQIRYQLLIASQRETLVDDFRRAGHRTATVMPAITTSWPEAVRLGYDDVWTARNIPYAGPPFYWVTMPDQFTWSFVGGVLRTATSPLFVEVGMVSSHAPWTPVLPLVEWDSIGDGSAFQPYRLEGYTEDYPPEEAWWDVEVLRAGYARSLAYSLEATAQFAERFLDERTLLIVAGDHQAAPWVTGASGADVPVHVIASERALLDPFLAWGFVPGTVPSAEGPAHRMDEFREWFVPAFSAHADAGDIPGAPHGEAPLTAGPAAP